MATVRLTPAETRAKVLPRVCACCGMPAAFYQAWSFSWSPPASVVLLFLGHGGHLAHLLLTKRATVWLPVCQEHLRRKRPGDLSLSPALLATLLGVGLALILAVIAAGTALNAGGAGNWVAACIVGAILVGAAAIAVAGAVIGVRHHLFPGGGPRLEATEITDRGIITLAGVSAEFARALERQRLVQETGPQAPEDSEGIADAELPGR